VRDLLEGIRVLDFGLAAVGPFCARVLCDLGAEVIHVEWPRTRWKAATSGHEESRFRRVGDGIGREVELFIYGNGGKKSLAVNLKEPEGVELVRKLVPSVDVIIENMTPRVMRGFGLDYESLAPLNPGLVMCSLTGFGQQGLDGDETRPCTDPIAQGMSGLSWITGERDGPPYAVGGGLGDTTTSSLGAVAILAALVARNRDGVGDYIDLSMVESLAYLDCVALPALSVTRRERLFRNGQQNSYTFPMGPFRANGGYVAIQAPGAGPDSPWGRLCALMGREDMVTDERLLDDDRRLEHAREVIDAVESWLVSLPDCEVALVLLAEARISSGPVLSQEQMLEHPFFAARQTFGTVEYPELPPVTVVEPPFKFTRSDAQVRGPAPEMGEHSREIVRELGLDEEAIDALMAANVLYESEGAKRRNATREGTS
jgi:crotonobetainyl-CoA:carnitine CoA-transferase CaiB-like acyl-CoA transferase